MAIKSIFLLLPSWLALTAQAVPEGAGLAERVRAVEAAIPNRPYHPPGYREMRVAAALEYRTFREIPIETDFGAVPVAGEVAEFTVHDIVDCNADRPDLEALDGREEDLTLLAMEVERIADDLDRAGYARAVYEQPLRDYERAELARLRGPESPSSAQAIDALPRLARQLDRRRARLQPRALRIAAIGDCGAGEISTRIVTVPASGQVWLINAFTFHVCQARGRDPWRLDGCRWTEQNPDRPSQLSGRYMYRARWPDGAERRGVREFSSGDPDDGVATVYFRRN